jgi:hypothetical protein
MLDFRQNSSRRSGEDRRERQRLLVLILMLGTVVVLIQWARDPAIWRGLDLLLSSPQRPADATSIDNRLDAAAQNGSLPDSFLAKSPPRASGEDRQPAAAHAQPSPLSVAPHDLEAVRDDAPSTHDEQDCALRLLDILNRTDPEALRQASLGPVTYAQLFRQPNQYRGRLVTVSGVVRRANRVKLPPNDYGIKEYYQIWLWPSDNPTAPVVVYCLQMPKGFPVGMEFAEQAEITGFFFKRWAYQAADSLRAAPELLARTLTWQQRPVMTRQLPTAAWPVPLLLAVAVLVALVAAWIVYLRTRPVRLDLPDRLPDFDGLPKTEQPDGAADRRG